MKIIKSQLVLTIILFLLLSSVTQAKMLYSETINDKLTYRFTINPDKIETGFNSEENLDGNKLFSIKTNQITYFHSIENIKPPFSTDDPVNKIQLKLYLTNSSGEIVDINIEDVELGKSNIYHINIGPSGESVTVEQSAAKDDRIKIIISNSNKQFKLNASTFEINYKPLKQFNLNDSGLPNGYNININYANHFDPGTTIEYSLPKNCRVKIIVFNMVGQEVKNLVNCSMPAGVHRIEWNGKDEFGNSVSTGIYFYKIFAGTYSETKKLIYMK